jgi:Flp pilus assembly protein TadG
MTIRHKFAFRVFRRVPDGRGPGLCRRRFSSRRATAAVEFAVATPMLVVMMGGAADYGLAQCQRSALANAVAAGAGYAYLTGNSVSPGNVASTVTQAHITSVIQDTFSSVPALAAAVTVSYSSISPGVPSPGWYCVTGSAPTVTSSTSGGVCTDGSSAGYYISFKATYTNTGIMNGFMSTSSQPMSEQATVKVQ